MTVRKSARFRVRRCFSLYPVHYSRAFAFSAVLYPQYQQRPLRFACPCGGTMGLPCSDRVSEWGGPFLHAGGLTSMRAHKRRAIPYRAPFWSKPVSTFGLLSITTLNRSSHMLAVPTHPLLLSAVVLADSTSPRGSVYRKTGGYVVPRASHQTVASSACLGRERLMEQPVSSVHRTSCETETLTTFRSHPSIRDTLASNRLLSDELASKLEKIGAYDRLNRLAKARVRAFK